MVRKLWTDGLKGLYRFIAFTGGKRIAYVLKSFVNAPGPVLFNCSWGKDRTGIIAALVLSILQVDEDDIALDFELTEKIIPKEKLQAMIPKTFRMIVFNDPEERQRVLNEISSAPGSAILDFLRMIGEEFGNIEGYLDEIGFDESWRIRMRNKYLE